MSNKYDLDILRKLIRKEATVPPKINPNGKAVVTLEEPGNSTSNNYSLKITKLPEDIVIIKADEFSSPDKFFNGDKGECKRADFIIIAQDDNKNWILHIEMKSSAGSNLNNREIVQQLKGAQCLVAYCRAIGRAFWQETKFLEEKNYQQCFVCITDIKISMGKTPTRIPPKSALHNTPENKLRIKTHGKTKLQFNELIRNPHS